jgi:hypothetical protein
MLPPVSVTPTRKRNRDNENFSKKMKSLLGERDGLVAYLADVYVLTRRKGKIWEYNCDERIGAITTTTGASR